MNKTTLKENYAIILFHNSADRETSQFIALNHNICFWGLTMEFNYIVIIYIWR